MSHLSLLLAAAVVAAPPGPIAAPAALPAIGPPPLAAIKKLADLPRWPILVFFGMTGNGFESPLLVELDRRSLTDLERDLARRPDDPGLLTRAAELAGRTKDEAAQKRFRDRLLVDRRQAAADRPTDAAAQVALAEALIDIDDDAAAVAAARAAIRLAPDSAAAWCSLARASDGAGEARPEVEAMLDKARRLAPADWKVPFRAAEVALDRAYRACDRVRLRGVTLPATAAPFLTARSCLALADREREAAGKLAGGDLEYARRVNFLVSGTLALRTRVEPEAVSPERLARAVAPSISRLADAEPADARAVMFAVMLDYWSAMEAKRGVSPRSRKSDGSMTAVTDSLPAETRARHAQWFARLRAIALRDDDPAAARTALVLGQLFGMLEQYADAIVVTRRAIRLTPDSTDAQDLLARLLLYGSPADVREAIALRQKLLQRSDTARGRYHLLRCYEAAGDAAALRAAVADALARHPNEPWQKLCAAAVAIHDPLGKTWNASDLLNTVTRECENDPTAGTDLMLETVRLGVICYAHGGFFAHARAGLKEWEDGGAPIRDADKLRAAIDALDPPPSASPVLVPVGLKEPAVPPTGKK